MTSATGPAGFGVRRVARDRRRAYLVSPAAPPAVAS